MFSYGWGNPNDIEKLVVNYKSFQHELALNDLDHISLYTEKIESTKDVKLYHFKFKSPFDKMFPNMLDENNSMARFLLIEPSVQKYADYKPLVIHYPRTSDQDYKYRQNSLGLPLAKDGISSILYTNPFYGQRKPKNQSSVYLYNVVDLFISGAVTMAETQYLIAWANIQGFNPIALHGISKGAHMSTLSTCVHNKPICNIPCLSWTTGSTPFIDGILNKAVDWKILSQQFHNNDIFKSQIWPLLSKIKQYNPEKYYRISENKPVEMKIKEKKSSYNIRNYLPINIQDGISAISDRSTSFIKSIEIDKQLIQQLQSWKFLNNRSKEPVNKIDKETMEFFCCLIDHFTHLQNYPQPKDPRLTTFVLAERDGFFPIHMMPHINELWSVDNPERQCQVRFIQGLGHVDAYVANYLYKVEFRKAIIDTLNRYIELYDNKPEVFEMTKKK